MALTHAILVSLCEQSGSGYELARRFDRSIGYFWTATHQQIYRTLAGMESEQLVSVTPVAQQGRPDKKVYKVSPAGRAELAHWIAEPLDGAGMDARLRNLAVKIRAAGYGDVEAVRAQVAALRDERAARLAVYRGLEARQFPDPDALTGADLHQHLVLLGGIRTEQGAIAWLDEVKEKL